MGKKGILALFLFMLVFIIISSSFCLAVEPVIHNYVPGEIIVVFKQDPSAQQASFLGEMLGNSKVSTSIASVNTINQKYGANAINGFVNKDKLKNAYKISYNYQNDSDIIELLMQDPNVAYARPYEQGLEEQLAKKLEDLRKEIAENGDTWTVGYTIPFIMTDEDQQKYLFGDVKKDDNSSLPLRTEALKSGNSLQNSPLTGLPYFFNWMNKSGKNYITSIKNQGSCGSCWAHAAIATLEGAIEAYFNKPELEPDLSESELINCDTQERGCNGGHLDGALYWISWYGIANQSCFTSIGSNCSRLASCASGSWTNTLGCVWSDEGGWSYSSWYSLANQIKRALIEYGPVGVSMDANGISAYTGGIIRAGGGIQNHAVVIVGWGTYDGETYWIVKNSWGSGWGENGTFRVFVGSKTIAAPDESACFVEEPIPAYDVSKNCEDLDSDGYCNWGLGDKPALGCPACSSIEDCDDSNPSIYQNCDLSTGEIGILNLTASPKYASVYVRDPSTLSYNSRGNLPLATELSAGERTIKLSNFGFADSVFNVSIRDGETTNKYVWMPRDPAFLEGWPKLNISSGGGSVIIDNLDGKGRDEVIAGFRQEKDDNPNVWNWIKGFYVWNANGTNYQNFPLGVGVGGEVPAAADLDSDGKLEIVTTPGMLQVGKQIYSIGFSGSETKVSSNESVIRNSLKVDNNKAVYFGDRKVGEYRTVPDIYLYDLSSGSEELILANNSPKNSLGISGNKIVWLETNYSGLPNNSIYSYDISTRQITRLVSGNLNMGYETRDNLVISGNKVVWQDSYYDEIAYSYKYSLNSYDFASGQISKLIEDTNTRNYLSIYNNKVVYLKQNDVYYYDLSSNNEIRVTNNASSKYLPVIYGNTIAWLDTRKGATHKDIFTYDLATSQERQRTNDTTKRSALVLSNNKLVYINTSLTSPQKFDILYYNLLTDQESQLTSNGFGKLDLQIYSDRVYWLDSRISTFAPINIINDDGTIASAIKIYNVSSVGNPTIYDIDSDGSNEILIVANFGDTINFNQKLYAFKTNGAIVSGFPVSMIGKFNLDSGLAVGDINDDGKVEIAAITYNYSYNYGHGYVYLFDNLGNSVPGFPIHINSTMSYGDSISPVIADLNKDGMQEIIVPSLSKELYIFNADGTNYISPINFSSSCASSYGACINTPVAVGDLENDTNPEIALVTGSGKLFVFNSSGEIRYIRTLSPAGPFLSAPMIGDINGDSKADVVVGASDGSGTPAGNLYAWNYAGSQILKKSTGKEPYYEAVSLGDLDKDGYVNIYSPSVYPAAEVFDIRYKYNYSTMKWRMYGHDIQRTNNYDFRQDPVCGNGVTEQGEQCDSSEDSLCPGRCNSICLCNKPTNLIAYYPLDSDVRDYSGNENHGNNYWTLFSAGKKGDALDFSGVDYIDTKDFSWNKTEKFSIGFWAYIRNTTNLQGIFGKASNGAGGTDSGGEWTFYIGNNTGNLTFRYYDDLVLNYPIADKQNQWMYITVTYNGSLAKMYINGIFNSSYKSSTSARIDNSYSAKLGVSYIGSSKSAKFYGKIDEVKIWGRDLSAEEVLQESGTGAGANIIISTEKDVYSLGERVNLTR